jgi:hypothetical protein
MLIRAAAYIVCSLTGGGAKMRGSEVQYSRHQVRASLKPRSTYTFYTLELA